MLDQAVKFINQHHGGSAVFCGRLDRDEAGRHGVDVFYAPRYLKTTKRKSAEWISLTKFGKANARERLKKRQDKDKKTGELLWNADGSKKEVWNGSSYFQGQVLQDLWFEHLRDELDLEWLKRGTMKLGRDADRLEVEQYKLKKDTLAAE